jgi:two-component system, OmpR family, manganese sensing response regulator
MAKILLVEDDHALGVMITKLLQGEHHHLDCAANGTYGEELITNYSYDLVILDWDLPGMSGLELCKKYRAGGGKLPILFLTGKTDMDSKITGLDSGADDYLCKPFEPRELLARIRVLLRRLSEDRCSVLKVGDISLDPLSKTAYRKDTPLKLVRKELAILEFMLRHPDEVFSLEALVERVWPSTSDVSPETVRPYIKRLRDKLEDAEGYCPIVTIHRCGYKFISPGK